MCGGSEVVVQKWNGVVVQKCSGGH